MNSRLKNIYIKLREQKLDGLLVTSPYNASYLADIISRDSYLLISSKKNIYFTDFRYIEEAKRSLRGEYLVKKIDWPIFNLVSSACVELGIRRLGFEEKYLSFAQYNKIKSAFYSRIELIPTHELIEEFRQIKSRDEIDRIRKAIQITVMALKFIRDSIVPGRKEIEVAAEAERFIRYNGARTSSFDIIVASGPNSSFPHHLTSDRKIQDNEPVLVDIGVDYFGYKSDLTRTFFLGRINPAVRRIYDIVREAQEKAIKKVKPGVLINKIDTAARQYITQRKYGGFFGHSLGHGIGLEVHEAPHISKKETDILKRGMVFTIEPAIYLPDKFGIRIEDIVLVNQQGCEVLSGTLNK